MNVKFGRSLQTYYAVTLFTLVGLVSYGIFYFWNNGPVNIDNVSGVFEATLQLEEIKKRDDIKKVWFQVQNDRVRDAVTTLDTLEKDTKKLDNIANVDSYAKFEESLDE